MRSLLRSFADFSWALSVFGVSQATKVLQSLPTGAAQEATRGFVVTSATLKEQFNGFDCTLYQLGEMVQNVLLGESADTLRPSPAALPQGISGFVGVWLCQSYSRNNAIDLPPPF